MTNLTDNDIREFRDNVTAMADDALADPTASRRDLAMIMRPGCPVHHGSIHGGEAAELRAGIEKLLEDYAFTTVGYARKYLKSLIYRVDARDSLAHGEREDAITSLKGCLDAAKADAAANFAAGQHIAADREVLHLELTDAWNAIGIILPTDETLGHAIKRMRDERDAISIENARIEQELLDERVESATEVAAWRERNAQLVREVADERSERAIERHARELACKETTGDVVDLCQQLDEAERRLVAMTDLARKSLASAATDAERDSLAFEIDDLTTELARRNAAERLARWL